MRTYLNFRLPLLAALFACSSVFLAASVVFADDKKSEKSEHGFYFVEGIDEAYTFEKEKFKEDKTKEIQDYIKKINDTKIKLCAVRWNKHGPPNGHNWLFTCEGECKEKQHCEIHVVYRASADEETKKKFKVVEGKDSSVTAPPHAFAKHVLLVYCECEKD